MIATNAKTEIVRKYQIEEILKYLVATLIIIWDQYPHS